MGHRFAGLRRHVPSRSQKPGGAVSDPGGRDRRQRRTGHPAPGRRRLRHRRRHRRRSGKSVASQPDQRPPLRRVVIRNVPEFPASGNQLDRNYFSGNAVDAAEPGQSGGRVAEPAGLSFRAVAAPPDQPQMPTGVVPWRPHGPPPRPTSPSRCPRRPPTCRPVPPPRERGGGPGGPPPQSLSRSGVRSATATGSAARPRPWRWPAPPRPPQPASATAGPADTGWASARCRHSGR